MAKSQGKFITFNNLQKNHIDKNIDFDIYSNITPSKPKSINHKNFVRSIKDEK